MKKFLKQKNKKEKGFTLIETLVALSIFLVSVIGIMSVLSGGLTDINSAKKKMTASFLAQQGVEYIRNMRDTYVLYSSLSSVGWTDFNAKILPCMSTGGCYLSDENLSFLDPLMPITGIEINQCTSNCPVIYFDDSNGKFNSFPASGSATSFIRTIEAKNITPDEINIIVKVSWGQNNSNSITLSESLFNWYE